MFKKGSRTDPSKPIGSKCILYDTCLNKTEMVGSAYSHI